MKVVKQKKCKQCGKPFYPYNPLQMICELTCALEYNKAKKVEKDVKQFKKNLQTHGYWTKILQAAFNAYIRERDKKQPCICCNKELGAVYHAGHFFTCGAFPALRFDEDNVHAQRGDCNLHKHGNTIEYAINLPKRIGKERFEALYNRRKNLSKWSIPELQEKIAYYKLKTKELKN